ncbi:MAG: type II toxin-antitoxin system prevent-host-death family antitoxin [Propionibacteriaceae bacterium]|jgi:prevent-host-death family protein|nr:type II toxin-antitoxin system prevent-host-death family antitoxin [Propionibacteriaceae bacterium]
MAVVSARELRNRTADVVARVRAGETVYLTSRGQRVARIDPVDPYTQHYLTPAEVVAFPLADAALRSDLAALGDEASDTVGPLL